MQAPRPTIPRAWVLGMLCLAAATTGTAADSWNLRSGASTDNVGLLDVRAGATWSSDGTPWGYPSLRLGYHGSSTGSLLGIPGGSRQDLSVLGTWITGFRAVRLTGALGLDVLHEPSSWRTEAQADWNTGVLGNMRATAAATSGWMEGWLAREVRSTSAKTSLGWDGPRTWAEIGAQLEHRTPGMQPASALPVTLEEDFVGTIWAWGTRSWTPWLQAGLAANAANSTRETHQAVSVENDTLRWMDVPYGSPHEEAAVSGLLRLTGGPVWIGTAWPLWSTRRQRVESAFAWEEAYWYPLENAAMAEVKAGASTVLGGRYAVSLEVKALSLPYTSRSWFTEDAWNQFGFELFVRFASPSRTGATP
jgi:hypothetical protein